MTRPSHLADSPHITVSTAKALIKEQFPQWAHLSISPIEVSGWDNRTFRLGDQMLMRLPSAHKYAAQVAKEQQWLPILSQHLSMIIPHPIAMGKPSKYYPWHWSIYRWIEGKSANILQLRNEHLCVLASSLAEFLHELHTIDTTHAPVPGPHNFYRGGALLVYDQQTKSLLNLLQDAIDYEAASNIWHKAIKSQWNSSPVWVHGDMSAGNILIKDEKLHAVIDFGCMSVGDPACDLVIAWTLFKTKSQALFRSKIPLDADTWARARGWALWKALMTLNEIDDTTSEPAIEQLRIINDIVRN